MLEHVREFMRSERETIIIYSDADDTASIFTRNVKLANKLGKMAEEHDEVKITTDDGYSLEVELPKRLIKVNAPRRKLEDEQKARLAARLATARRENW